jgi:hypothetical protein
MIEYSTVCACIMCEGDDCGVKDHSRHHLTRNAKACKNSIGKNLTSRTST